MSPRTLSSSPHAQPAPNDDRPVIILATRTGLAEGALRAGLRAEGFEVRRCLSEPEILDAFTDALLGHTARPELLLIGSGLYRQLRERIGALIGHLHWDVQVMVQVDERPPSASPPARTRDPAHRVGAAMLPRRVAHMASRQLADARLTALCHADQRSWRAAEQLAGSRHVGEGP